MNTIARIILAAVFGVTALAAAPAHADTYEPVCVQDTDGQWFPFTIESEADRAWIGARVTRDLPNTAQGCNAYGPVKAPPYDTQPAAAATACQPTVVTKTVAVERVVVDTTQVDALTAELSVTRAKVERQQAVIARLRVKLARR